MDAALAAVRSPLMAIQSTTRDAQLRRSPLKPGETSPWLDLLKKTISDLKIDIVPGVGHFPQLEAAQTVNRLIRDFLAAHR
jgi:pimeloyl-ACP methyl ester carboxylesterase